jgi:hypothetical protein
MKLDKKTTNVLSRRSTKSRNGIERHSTICACAEKKYLIADCSFVIYRSTPDATRIIRRAQNQHLNFTANNIHKSINMTENHLLQISTALSLNTEQSARITVWRLPKLLRTHYALQ